MTGSRGFSLIETLVALSILSAGLLAMATALDAADAARKSAAAREDATHRAEERLLEAAAFVH